MVSVDICVLRSQFDEKQWLYSGKNDVDEDDDRNDDERNDDGNDDDNKYNDDETEIEATTQLFINLLSANSK